MKFVFANRNYIHILIQTILILSGMLTVVSCVSGAVSDADKTLKLVERYLSATKDSDIALARSYWLDFNNPGGNWTMIARRDMEMVTMTHTRVFADGFEIINSRYENVPGLNKPVGNLKLDVRITEGEIKKLEVGLFQYENKWYIYSIYPGQW